MEEGRRSKECEKVTIDVAKSGGKRNRILFIAQEDTVTG